MSTWTSDFDNILKQAVLKCTLPTVIPTSDMSWDKNGNGIFDHFVRYTGAPNEKIELTEVLKAINEYDGCYENNDQATIVISFC
jgi:hypothetical protein